MPTPYLDRLLRTEAEAAADIARDREDRRFRCLERADKLDELIVAAKGLKLKLQAAHKWPADPAVKREWQLGNASFANCFDLTDEIGFMEELVDSLEFQREMLRRER